MHPCELGHPCMYGQQAGPKCVCAFPHCVMQVVQDEDGTEQVLNQITGMWSRLVRNPTEDHDVTERADATRTISIPEFLSYVDIMRRNEQVFEKQDDGKWKVRSMRHPL